MSSTRVVAGAFAVGAIAGLFLVGAGIPPIGKIMRDSPDFEYVKSGCPIKYDAAGEVFRCADRTAVATIPVTLSGGQWTDVTHDDVHPWSTVICGCWPCNERGSWSARIVVDRVSDGEFRLRHGYALGAEQLTCVVL